MVNRLELLIRVLRLVRTRRSALARYALAALAFGAIVYAYPPTGPWDGWPPDATQPRARQLLDAFEASAGVQPGFRRNHAKGICVSGRFESNGEGSALSRALVFERGSVPVTGRLSISGGDPGAQDNSSRIRGLALRFKLRDGEEWRTAMNSVPVFAVRTPEALYAELVALRPDTMTGKPDPSRITPFIHDHPEFRAFQSYLTEHPPSSGFDNTPYFSVNAFRFVDTHDLTRYVRWSLVPETPYQAVTAEKSHDPDFLAHEFTTHVAESSVRWRLIITVAKQGDPTDDATRTWPDDRETVAVGTLIIDRVQPQIDGPCRDIDFDPLVLPAGIEPSGDPLLAARSDAYRVSLARRLHEESNSEGSR